LPGPRRYSIVETMTGDIAVAGFVLTADEWKALDTKARTQLLEAAFKRELDRERISSRTGSGRATR
jgi:hypothetical protein